MKLVLLGLSLLGFLSSARANYWLYGRCDIGIKTNCPSDSSCDVSTATGVATLEDCDSLCIGACELFNYDSSSKECQLKRDNGVRFPDLPKEVVLTSFTGWRGCSQRGTDSGYKLVVDGPYGALGGNSFTDNDVSSAGKVTKIEFSLTKRLGGAAGFRFTYGNTPGTFHGNSGRGGIHEVVLDADEKIIGLKGNSGRYLDQITFITNKRDIGPFGMEDPGPDSFNENRPNCTALFFFGRSGAWMDSLGLVYECPE